MRSASSRNWDKVSGIVERLFVEEIGAIGHKSHFQARVEYSYVYRAVRLHGYAEIGYQSFFRGDAERELNAFRVGQTMDIYVYKKKPSVSRLNSGIDYLNFSFLVFGIALIGFSSYQILKFVR